jgi:hypothetical protein
VKKRPHKFSTTARGYGSTHQATRRRYAALVATDQAKCARCGQPILPGEPWDLGHTEDRQGYTGPEHARCNRAAGDVASQRRSAAPFTSPDGRLPWSRKW